MSEMERIGELVRARSLEVLGSGSDLVRRGLAEVTRLEADPRLVELVETMKGGAPWSERVRAWEEIHEIGPSATGWTDLLRGAIYNGDGWGRIFAAELLSWHRLCQEDAVPVLVTTLLTTLELGRCEWARMACGALERYDNLSSPLVGLAVPALIEALDAGDPDVQDYAAMALGAWGARSKKAVVRLAGLAEVSEGPRRERFMTVLQKIDPAISSWEDAVMTALDAADPLLRAMAAEAVFERGTTPPEILSRLLPLSRDESPVVRKYVALSLANVGEVDDVVIVHGDALAQDSDQVVRLAASYAMARLGIDRDRHLDVLLEGLRSHEALCRSFSARTLGALGPLAGRRAASAVSRALAAEPDDEVREVLEEVLERL